MVVSTTVTVTVCSAVTPAEFATTFLMAVEPSGKTYVARAIRLVVATRKVLMAPEMSPCTGSVAVGAYLPATLVPR